MKARARKPVATVRPSAMSTSRPKKALDRDYDVFLSHRAMDHKLVTELNDYIEQELKFEAYVDWKDSRKELDRRKVSEETAAYLRKIMRHARSLIFVVSANTPASKWMPWELGFFDGRQSSRRIGVYLPDDVPSLPRGQEYLGMYRVLRKNDIEAFLLDAVLDVAALDSATSDQWLRHFRRAVLRPDDYWLSIIQWHFGYAANLLTRPEQEKLMPDEQPPDEPREPWFGPWLAALRRWQYAVADLRRQLEIAHRRMGAPETSTLFPLIPWGGGRPMVTGGPLHEALPMPDGLQTIMQVWLAQPGVNPLATLIAGLEGPAADAGATKTASRRARQ
jgi:hypothetical protein